MHKSNTANFIAYTRCSTDEQHKRGNSHEYQIDGIRRSGVVRSGNLNEAYHFQDTVTGTRFDNRVQGLDQAYKVCERNRGAIQYLFVYRWDRLGRDVGECFAMVKRFRAIGVEVNCPDEWIEYSDPTYPVLLGLKFGMAQGESMRISDRTRDGQHAATMAGVHIGKPPVGYRKSDRPMHINGKPRMVCVADELKAPLVRECFERVAKGEQRSDLYKEYRHRLGIGWSKFYAMFTKVFYTGKLIVRAHRDQPATIVEGLHTPIIPQDLFDIVNNKIKYESKVHRKSWTLDGSKSGTMFYLKKTLYCDKSGRPMRASLVKGKSGKYFAYYHGFGKGAQNILAVRAHAIFLAALSDLKIQPENALLIRRTLEHKLNEREQNLDKALQAARKNKQRAVDRTDRLRDDYADGNITAAEYRDFKRAFDADVAKYEAEIVNIEEQQAEREEVLFKCLALMERLDTIFQAADENYKSLIARAVFPNGVFIDTKRGKVQTPCINDVVIALCGESDSYEVIEIKNGTTNEGSTAKGQSQYEVQTPKLSHIQLLKALFAA